MTTPDNQVDTDVIIVGAGPTGLTAACALQQAGVRVEVLERSAEGAGNSRAAVVHASTLEAFAAIDVAAEIIAEGLRFDAFAVYRRDERLIRVEFDGIGCRFPFVVTIPQNITEQILHRRLVSLGGQITRSTTVTELIQASDHVRVTAVGDDGRSVSRSARYVIGADGVGSTVRKLSGIEFPGSTYPDEYMLADVTLRGYVTDDEVCLYFSPAGSVIVAALPGGIFRIMCSVAGAFDPANVAALQDLLEERGPGGLTVDTVVWASKFQLQRRLAETYARDRVILAGDAAHVHSPTGGQGMNMGVHDAVDLANRIVGILRTGAADDLLLEYSSTRRRHAATVLEFTDRAMRVSNVNSRLPMALRNEFLRTVGVFPAVRKKIARRVSGIESLADIGVTTVSP
ncbi:FAD-dependent oxidoreductase [Nocardia sp. NPDC055053]